MKETIQWHPAYIEYPTHMALILLQTNNILLQTNNNILVGFWNESEYKWMAKNSGEGYIFLNSDTQVLYWAYWPKGV